ncbi:hypothetical protein WMW72_02150 [Paenibacillus filicis]|uniref:Ribosomal protein L7/L12 C-terminal domain-containing protein n=1 Tax=Paenibacillus filicis TaxID=669464 RepID=A0ABU9DD56_9BACL
METVEFIAISALILSLLLLLKVFSLQRQLHEIKSDLQWLSSQPEGSGSPRPSEPPASPRTRISSPPPVNLDQRLRALLASGKRIQAIKEYRNASGLSLQEAREYVDALEQSPY